ncbi:craniofacial development protein 2-like [Procambarus clarkii]|uniref:craniofacial development protein 2-like n=1 Tax=Procambarus clarkii TaxID=6728 RepID=UPI003743D786
MASLINVYAPKLISSTEAKGEFYDDLGLTLRDTPQQEPVFFLGDFNARVGSDHSSWPSYLDQFGKMHESGQRLLEFWCRHDLCIIISFFDTKPQHKVSWSHLRSKYWHQLYLVLTGQSNLRSVNLTRSFQSADCDTDHSLFICRVKFQPRKIHRAKKEGRPRINVNKTRDLHKVEEITTLQPRLPQLHTNTTLETRMNWERRYLFSLKHKEEHAVSPPEEEGSRAVCEHHT